MQKVKAVVLPLIILVGLSLSFFYSTSWMTLCAGLALFLFGMQCLEEGLKQLAGGKLEILLAKSTETKFKSFLFGAGGTSVLQSTTLMSLLTVAFLSTGLLHFSSSIAILIGINLGTVPGMWLLAAAGQNFSLSVLALPLLVFGVLAGFTGSKGKAAGRIVLGIAFIFLGIENIKNGFNELGDAIDLTSVSETGWLGSLLFVGIGILLTAVLQSSHATMILILAALATNQIDLTQGMAAAIGGNLGSSVTTAIMGWLGGNRSGQKLVLAHVIFNLITGIACFALLAPLAWLCVWLMSLVGLGENTLLQLALFQTFFGIIGFILFWPAQDMLVRVLERIRPNKEEPAVLIEPEVASQAAESAESVVAMPEPIHARYLDKAALSSVDTAMRAIVMELKHLGRLSLEVICHALYQPVEQLTNPNIDDAILHARPNAQGVDAQILYQQYIKSVYADILDFMSRVNIDFEIDEDHQRFWVTCQIAALQLVDAVKDAKHLQKNLGHYLREGEAVIHNEYIELRSHLMWVLRQIRELGVSEDMPEDMWLSRLEWVDSEAANFDAKFRADLFTDVREQKISSMQASSLMNDLGYCSRIIQGLRNVMKLGFDQESFLRGTPASLTAKASDKTVQQEIDPLTAE